MVALFADSLEAIGIGTGSEDEPLLTSLAEDKALLASTLGTDIEGIRYYGGETAAPPPPPTSPKSRDSMVSSLDFDRIVNQYSIQAVRDQWLLPSLPADGSATSNGPERPMEGLKVGRSPQPIRTSSKLRKREHTLLGYTGRTATRWFLTVLAGLLTGLISTLIVNLSGIVVGWRSSHVQTMILDSAYSNERVLLVFVLLNAAEALAASMLCVGWIPQAAGSGIPDVKAYLNGIRSNQKFTRLPLFVVKVVGNILSVSSGLAVGQEGPLIHIGAIVGSGCSKISGITSKFLQGLRSISPQCMRNHHNKLMDSESCVQKMLAWTNTELSHFATDAERHDFVAIGASCGFAASFGAPVGGLLFVLDDISSHFSKNLLLRLLLANAVGTFCLAVQHGDLSNYSVISLGHYQEISSSIYVSRVEEFPLYILMGLVGGILGGSFVASCMWLRRNITGRFPKQGKGRGKWQMLEVVLVSLLTSLLLFYLPMQVWACKPKADPSTIIQPEGVSSLQDQFEGESRKRFFCPEGEINELANMLFGSRIEAIKRILTDPTEFKLETLLSVGVTFYVLMTLTFGTAIPSGIFTPSVLIGASLGGAAGLIFQNKVDPDITPSTFALLGVASLLAGIQRSTVSVAVILVEGTGKIKVLTPAIIVVVVARYVASCIYEDGIHEAVLNSKKVPYLEHEKAHQRRYDAIEVGDILEDCPLETVSPRERAFDLVQLLERSNHNGFPVVDPRNGKFLGLVRRDQIAALLECGVFDKSTGDESGSAWTRPQSGLDKSPLMRWAYTINDDRYDYIHRTPTSKDIPRKTFEKAPPLSMISSPNLHLAKYSPLPTEFAAIAENNDGQVYVTWLNPDYATHWINIGAVMNRGSYCVSKFCPVSKAYKLFTTMGLRHLAVLGGKSGGEVIGVLTRANFLPAYIKDKTGL